jgi:hypothetical protein
MVAIPNAPRMGDMPKGEPVPEGLYYLRCDKAEFKLSKEKPGGKGKEPMAEVTFTIFGPDEQEQYHGRKLFENFMLAGEGMFRTRNFIEAAGEDEEFVLEDTEWFVGQEVAAHVQIEQARVVDGKQVDARNKVKKYQAI